ncbi:hypothetical protein [Streptomyces sp. NPDC001415]
MRYDTGWSQHEEAYLALNLRTVLRQLPRLLAFGFRPTWRADPRAARGLVAANLGRGLARAASLLAVNRVLAGPALPRRGRPTRRLPDPSSGHTTGTGG